MSPNDQTSEAASTGRLLALIALAATTTALAVLLPFQIRSFGETKANSEEALRKQATVAITSAVIALTSPSGRNADTYVKDMVSRSTGSFRSDLLDIAKLFEKTVREAKVSATSRVASAGMTDLDVRARKASMIVAVTQDLSNKRTPKGEPRYYRFEVKAEKQGDRWLIYGMRFVP